MVNIHPIPTGFGFSFLVEAPPGLYLIDSGSPGQEKRVLAKMQALGRKDLRMIWTTHAHYDHYGSAGVLRELTGAPVGVHPLDAGSMIAGQSPLGTPRGYGRLYTYLQPLANRFWPLRPTQPDFTIEDGGTLQRFGLAATVLHTPGHTPGHTCLLLPDGTALAGDLLGRFPRPRLQGLLATDWAQLPGSLARFQAARPQWTYTGHSSEPISGTALMKIHP